MFNDRERKNDNVGMKCMKPYTAFERGNYEDYMKTKSKSDAK